MKGSHRDTEIGRIVVPPGVPDGFVLFYTTRDFEGRLPPANYERLMSVIQKQLGHPATLATCTQVHGATVHRANVDDGWRECDSCDALWTSQPNVALGIKVADCLPVTVIDPVHGVLANIHSGWRGAVQQITRVTLDTIAAASAFDPATSVVFLGPSIRACCFEVGEEVVAEFLGSYGDISGRIDRSRTKAHIDLPGLTRDMLIGRGFAAERVVDTGLCTRCEGSPFHSYRRDGANGGRNLAIVAH